MKNIFTVDFSLYKKEIIQKAIEEFNDSGMGITILDSGIEINSDTQEENEEIFHELMNYYIGLFNQ